MNSREKLRLIYKRYRDALFCQLYYGHRFVFWQRINRCLAGISFFASSGVILHLYLSAQHADALEKALTSSATIASGLLGAFKMKDFEQNYSELFTGHRILYIELRTLVEDIQVSQCCTEDHFARFQKLASAFNELEKKDDVKISERLKRRYNPQVNATIPAEKLWMPLEDHDVK